MKNYLHSARILLLAGLAFAWACDDATTGGGPTDAGDGGGGTGGDGGPGGEGGGGQGGQIPEDCTRDDDCPDGRYCSVPEGDLVGDCIPGCRIATDGTDDCDEGEVCDPATHQCNEKPPEPCTEDEECPDGQYCDEGTCKDGCRGDADCPNPGPNGRAQVCDMDTRACVDLFPCCAADGSCTAVLDGACDGQQLEAALSCGEDAGSNPCGDECQDDEACDPGQYCNEVDNRCQQGCRQGIPDECPEGQTCDDKHRCVELNCDSDDDCPDHQFCDNLGDNPDLRCYDGCRLDDPNACPGGEVCDPLDHTCGEAPCDPDDPDACGEGEHCSPRTGVCEEDCDVEDPNACGPGEFCNPDSLECEPGCVPDDDNTQEDATAIELGEPMDGIQRGQVNAQICGDDTDWYSVEVGADGRLRVELSYDPAGGDLDFRLYGGDLPEDGLAFDGLESPEVAEYPELNQMLPATTYYIEVFAKGELVAESLEYRLDVAVAEAGACFPDARDFGDDLRAGATRIEMNQANYAGRICPEDVDWFAWAGIPNGGLNLRAVASAASSDMAIEIYSDTRVNQPGGLANPNFTAEMRELADGQKEYTIVVDQGSGEFSDEDWFIRVRGANDEAVADYRMEIQLTDGGECGNDGGSEPNDDRASGVDLDAIGAITADGQLRPGEDLEVPLDLEICARDVDFFCFTASDNDIVEAWVVGNGVAGVLDIQFYSPAGQAVGRSAVHTNPGEPTDVASVQGTDEGVYCVSVDGAGPAQGPYDLFVRREPAVGVCGADRAEVPDGPRNDSPQTATALPDVSADGRRFEYEAGYICDANGADEDWYRFPVGQARSALCVMLDGFTHDASDVQFEVFDAAGNPQGQACANQAACADGGGACVGGRCTAPIFEEAISTTDYDFELARINRTLAGDAVGDRLVRVRHDDQGEAPYRLTVTVTPEDEMCPDDWEEAGARNDAQENAAFLGAGAIGICDGWICDNDGDRARAGGDWYEIEVPPGEDRTVFLDYQTDAEGRLAMTILSAFAPGHEEEANGDEIKGEIGVVNAQCLNIRGGAAAAAAWIQVRVPAGFVGDNNRIDYSLRIVPTNLAGDPFGECLRLGANPDLPVCDPRAEWPERVLGGNTLRIQPDNCYATHELP